MTSQSGQLRFLGSTTFGRPAWLLPVDNEVARPTRLSLASVNAGVLCAKAHAGGQPLKTNVAEPGAASALAVLCITYTVTPLAFRDFVSAFVSIIAYQWRRATWLIAWQRRQSVKGMLYEHQSLCPFRERVSA